MRTVTAETNSVGDSVRLCVPYKSGKYKHRYLELVTIKALDAQGQKATVIAKDGAAFTVPFTHLLRDSAHPVRDLILDYLQCTAVYWIAIILSGIAIVYMFMGS